MPKTKKTSARPKTKRRSSLKKAGRTNRTAIKKARFLKAYALNSCIITAACKASGIGSRGTISEWRSSDPDFESAMLELDEGDLDFSEGALKKQIKKGNLTAIIFHLKTKGKKRGYIEKTEFEGNLNHTAQLSMNELQKSLKGYDEVEK